MKKFDAVMLSLMAGVLALGLIVGCPSGPTPPTPPPPTPPPTDGTPPKGTPVASEMLLRQEAARLHDLNGKPFQAFMAVPCCMTPPPQVENSRWPLASEEWMDYTRDFGANMFHFRMGPFYGDAEHESEWADIGGAYIGSGPEFNQAFFDKVRDMTYHALKFGAYVEVNTIDTWYCKHAASNWGDQQMPWPQADIDACGIAMTPVQERFIRKTVEELGCFGNVVWLTDNEGDQINGAQRGWYEDTVKIIRDEELKSGCGFVHMIGTNSQYRDVADYVAVHSRAPVTGPIEGRWTINNERNPEFVPAQEEAYFRQAREAGQAWAFWRAGMSDEAAEDTLNRFKNVVAGGGGGTPIGCFPPPDGDGWGLPVDAGHRACQRCDVINEAKTKMASPCGNDPSASLEAFGATLRSMGYCAGKMNDAVFLKAPDGLWEEHHVIAYTNGCYTNTQNGYKGAWPYAGENPNPPVGCTAPVPAGVSTWGGPKVHNRWYDATPLVNNCNYCESIGMGEINGTQRCICPVRNECPGVKCEERPACERAAMKGLAAWRSDGEVEVNTANENHLQARCSNCTWLEVCDANGANCKRVEVQ